MFSRETPARGPGAPTRSENRERLEALADALFRAETLEGLEAYAAAAVRVPVEGEAAPEEQAPSDPAGRQRRGSRGR